MNRRNDDDMLGTAALIVGQVPADKRACAVRRVAASARDADDCVTLCDVLGLDPAEGRIA